MRRRQADHGGGIAVQPPRTLERHDVGRISDQFRAAQRREHVVLAGMAHDGAHAQRGDRRQLNRFKSGRRSQEMSIDFDEAPLIDDRRQNETVAIPLLQQFRRPASGGPRLRYVEQERPQARRWQFVRQRLVGARRQPRFDPWS
jgi:hypothetical protein